MAEVAGIMTWKQFFFFMFLLYALGFASFAGYWTAKQILPKQTDVMIHKHVMEDGAYGEEEVQQEAGS